MIHLFSNENHLITSHENCDPLILPITENANLHFSARSHYALRYHDRNRAIPHGYSIVLLSSDQLDTTLLESAPKNTIRLSKNLDYLTAGDIIKYNPNNTSISVLFRKNANANSFLLTERCNSFCIMCSQPPRSIDDSYRVNDILSTLPLIPHDTCELGFTGGEPTLLGNDFISLIKAAKTHLPRTAIHILTNARNFIDQELTQQVARIQHDHLTFGIPIYADYSQLHNYIVQADNAFDDTVRGILNLKRYNQRVEIRVVIQRDNFKRLPKIANFIVRNLLFVDHVALMGIELMGFAKINAGAIWIDPNDYRDELIAAVTILHRFKIEVSIFNLPLCVIPEKIRSFSVKSISDWKNDFVDECDNCTLRKDCCGFFSSNLTKISSGIKAFL